MWFEAKKKIFHKIERNNCGLCGHNTDPSPGNHVGLMRELCLMDAFAREIWMRFLVLYHTERWRVSIESSSCRWTVSRSNPSYFVLLCVSLFRCYPLSLFASLYGFPPLLLACGPMIVTASVEQTRLSHLLRPSIFPNIQKCMDIKDNCMSCAYWHAIQQIITSCHGSLAFSQQCTRTWEGVEFNV